MTARQVWQAVNDVIYWCPDCNDEQQAEIANGRAAQRMQARARRHANKTGHTVHVTVSRVGLYSPQASAGETR